MLSTFQKPSNPGNAQCFLSQVQSCILARLDDESFGVAELAEALHISRTQLFRRIKALTGRNVARYIHQVRIDQVKDLLAREENLSVTEIAYRAGFVDAGYLRRVFLLETGETLASYRQRACQKTKCFQKDAT